ncbi:MAG: hypothetical protein JRI25_07485 [Deltaproteobacteria bacterium]|nr:hypothetical protein [Deltaproteobacteria bacterium]MBW2254424.1 hypothetical protein [Deltaproteobacteria bacterium]
MALASLPKSSPWRRDGSATAATGHDEMTVTGTEGDYTLTMDLRWEFYEP